MNATVRPFATLTIGARAEITRTLTEQDAAAQTRLVGAGAVWIDAAVKFLAPVRIGDTVTTVAEIAEIQAERRILELRATATTATGTVVMTGESTVKHPRELDG